MGTITIQPGTRGADFTYLTDDIKRWLLDNNIAYVLRYVVPPTWTRINKDYRDWETAWYAEHNIAVLPNFERHHDDATRSADDHAQGRANGLVFIDLCKRFGFPTDIPHFCSVDQDIWYRNIDEAERYVRGFNSVLDGRPLGLYGDDDITYRVRDLNPIQWRPAAGGWDGEPRPVTTHIRQRLQVKAGGSLLDPNDTIHPFKAWAPGTASNPDPIPPQEKPDMYIWSPKGYANAFLIGAGPATPVSPKAYKHLTEVDKVPTILQDTHEPTLLAVLHQSGLRVADLERL